MREITYCGLQVKEHPGTGAWIREDGAVLVRDHSAYSTHWTFGNVSAGTFGYAHVCLVRNGKKKVYKVHRLVAESFLDNPENKRTVDHINRIKDDNRVVNLRWATYKEQIENSGKVLNRTDYGVRKCDNPTLYARITQRIRRAKKKEAV